MYLLIGFIINLKKCSKTTTRGTRSSSRAVQGLAKALSSSDSSTMSSPKTCFPLSELTSNSRPWKSRGRRSKCRSGTLLDLRPFARSFRPTTEEPTRWFSSTQSTTNSVLSSSPNFGSTKSTSIESQTARS